MNIGSKDLSLKRKQYVCLGIMYSFTKTVILDSLSMIGIESCILFCSKIFSLITLRWLLSEILWLDIIIWFLKVLMYLFVWLMPIIGFS